MLCGGDDVMAATARLLALHPACCNLLPTSASSSPSQHTVDKLGGSDPRGNRRRTAFSSDLHTVDEDEENRLGNLERGEVGRLFAVFAIGRKVRLILTHTYTHAHSCHFISFILFYLLSNVHWQLWNRRERRFSTKCARRRSRSIQFGGK